MTSPPIRAAVVLASAGRPELLAEAVAGCRAQETDAFRGLVSVPDDASLPEDSSILNGWEIVSGSRGLAAQRNAGLERLNGEADVVFFFDDDAVVRSDYLDRALAFFRAHPTVVGITGRVLADGKISGEIDLPTTTGIIHDSWNEEVSGRWRFTRELYGANFAVRVSRAPELRFDERLPLYSWLEDHDFARRLMPYGPLVELQDCVIVHRAAASGGRSNHKRLGYSQVMNPVYLARKRSFPLWLAAQQLLRPTLKNIVLAATGDRARRERLRGNMIATLDVARGRITPERISTQLFEAPDTQRGNREMQE